MDWMQHIQDAQNMPYKLGEHDCLRLACAVAEVRTGVDHWPTFKGYKTKRQALARIAKVAPSLAEAITKTLTVQPILPTLAQRGDLVIYKDVEEHIGICIGEHVVVLGEEGLLRVLITSPDLKAAWRLASCQLQ